MNSSDYILDIPGKDRTVAKKHMLSLKTPNWYIRVNNTIDLNIIQFSSKEITLVSKEHSLPTSQFLISVAAHCVLQCHT